MEQECICRECSAYYRMPDPSKGPLKATEELCPECYQRDQDFIANEKYKRRMEQYQGKTEKVKHKETAFCPGYPELE